MIFGRGKAKGDGFSNSYRSVESQTLERWENIASQTTGEPAEEIEIPLTLRTESAKGEHESSTEDATITLTNEAVLSEAERNELWTPRMPTETIEDIPEAVQSLPPDLSVTFEEDLKRRFGGNVRSALGPGTVIEGTFKFDSPVCIDGTLTGEVSSTSALIVGAQATVNARIKVGSLIVLGTVNGDIEASELVEIRGHGQLEGDILTRRFVMEDGGLFNGCCNMLD